MKIKMENELDKYIFPVTQEKVYYPSDGGLKITEEFKSIVREDTGQIISVMKDSYKLIPNRTIIESLLSQLDKTDCQYIINKQHSYVDNSMMRLSVHYRIITLTIMKAKSSCR